MRYSSILLFDLFIAFQLNILFSSCKSESLSSQDTVSDYSLRNISLSQLINSSKASSPTVNQPPSANENVLIANFSPEIQFPDLNSPVVLFHSTALENPSKDWDFDGLTNKIELSKGTDPYIADVPEIEVKQYGKAIIGIEYKVSGQKIDRRLVEYNNTSNYDYIHNINIIKHFGIGSDMSLSGGKILNSASSLLSGNMVSTLTSLINIPLVNISTSYENTSDEHTLWEMHSAYKNEFLSSEDRTVTYGPNDGYLIGSIIISNNSGIPAKVSNIEIEVFIGNEPNNVRLFSYKCKGEYEIAGNSQVGPIPIEKRGINTKYIIDMLNYGSVATFKIVSANITSANRKINYSKLHPKLLSSTVLVSLMTNNGIDKKRIAVNPYTLGNYQKPSLHDVLKYIYGNNIEFKRNENGQIYIFSLNGYNTNEGIWVVGYKAKEYNGKIDDKNVNAGDAYELAYINKDNLFKILNADKIIYEKCLSLLSYLTYKNEEEAIGSIGKVGQYSGTGFMIKEMNDLKSEYLMYASPKAREVAFKTFEIMQQRISIQEKMQKALMEDNSDNKYEQQKELIREAVIIAANRRDMFNEIAEIYIKKYSDKTNDIILTSKWEDFTGNDANKELLIINNSSSGDIDNAIIEVKILGSDGRGERINTIEYIYIPHFTRNENIYIPFSCVKSITKTIIEILKNGDEEQQKVLEKIINMPGIAYRYPGQAPEWVDKWEINAFSNQGKYHGINTVNTFERSKKELDGILIRYDQDMGNWGGSDDAKFYFYKLLIELPTGISFIENVTVSFKSMECNTQKEKYDIIFSGGEYDISCPNGSLAGKSGKLLIEKNGAIREFNVEFGTK